MRFTRPALAALVFVMMVAPFAARAAQNVLVAANVTFGEGSCLTFLRTSNQTQVGSRGEVSFWPDAEALPGAVCPEDAPHVHLRLTCVEVEAVAPLDVVTVWASAKGSDGEAYLLKMIDRGSGGDEAGVIQAASTAPERCGAGEVPTHATTDGVLVALAG